MEGFDAVYAVLWGEVCYSIGKRFEASCRGEENYESQGDGEVGGENGGDLSST